MANLADGGFVRKYHVALFINKGTSGAPDWFRIEKSTDNTVTMNATTQDYDFIVDESPTTVLNDYKPSLYQPITMIKGQADYEYFFEKFYNQSTGDAANTEILIVFYNELVSGTTFKAWKSGCSVAIDNINPVEGTLTANLSFNGTTEKGTATVTNGVPVFAGTGETWFALTITVELSSDPVAGATVMLNGTKAITNADGEAVFTVKNGDTYVLGAYDSSSHDASEVFTAASGTTAKTVTIA